MRRIVFHTLTLCFCCLIFAMALALGDENPWGEESSIPRWAEAEIKNRLFQGPVSPVADSIHSYDVLLYRLNLYFPVTTRHLEGSALIRCRSEEDDLYSIILHLEEHTVDSVLVDGDPPQSWSHAGGELIVHFDMPFSRDDTFEVLVGYGGSPSYGYYTTGSGQLRTGYTVTPPYESRHWFPCWDEPWDKADEGCEIHAEVPQGFVVASNGLLAGVDTTFYPSDTTVTYHWVESFPIATYLMSVAIAPYKQILDYYVAASGDSVEVRHFVYGPDSSTAMMHFGETPDMMAFFASIFGEYPFEKYGMACVTNFWGGMENQTMTTILRDAVISGWETGVSHELAHQWWGDMVTCFNWPDVWLNEGFATYAEALWHEHKYGFASFRRKMTTYGNDYFHGPHTHDPLYDPPVLFSWDLVYTKGAWVLHMLRHIVGDVKFSEILRAYGEKFEYGIATTEDFRGVVDSVMNDSFAYYFDQWIYQPFHPDFEYGWKVQELGGKDHRLDLKIWQTQRHGPLFRMPVDLRLSYAGGDTTFAVWVDAAAFQEIRVPLTLPTGASNFSLAFDPDNWLLDKHVEIPYTMVHVISTFPRRNGLNVPDSVTLSVTFDADMDETTINDSTFIVNARSAGFRRGTVSYNSQTRTATFDPLSDFEDGDVVTALLTTDIESSLGRCLDGGYAWSFTVNVSDGIGTFAPDSTYPVSGGPYSVFAADLDDDGDLDQATANMYSNNISVLLNNGDGTFASRSDYPVGYSPRSIFAADLDGDGDIDLTTANAYSGNISVLPNNGDGTFAPRVDYAVGNNPMSIAAANLDGDGDIDLAVANSESDNVSVLLNAGDGTFDLQADFPAGNGPISVIAADLDGDGDIDMATANIGSDNISVLLNNGDSTFTSNLVFPGGDSPRSVVAADLDDDGNLELITANSESDDVSVLANYGGGAFALQADYPVGDSPVSVVAADLDGDGDLDMVTANRLSDDVSVLLNNKDGSFDHDADYPAGDMPVSTFAADLDSDGDLDLTTANAWPNKLSVLLNREVDSPEQIQLPLEPRAYSLEQNYPNPFNAITEIPYDLPQDSRVRLELYNISGQKVATLVDNEQKAGYRTAMWNACSLPSGIYFCRLKAGEFMQTKKMILLK